MKKYNFNAGPSILPREVIEKTAQQCLDFNGSGLSLMEISHRAKDFQPVVDEAVALVKELLDIPEGYSVIFLGGGASLEFCMIPFNFLIKKAAYLNTGVWAKKAMKEAKLFGEVVEVASSADANYTFIPKDWTVPADADYLHITTNNTIYGTEIRKDLDVNVPLIADMSSDIFSRPVDVKKYDAIYAGAQKNMAMAGVTVIIVKDDKLGRAPREIPTMLDYRTHVEKGSMFNTPPVVPIYCALENLRWVKKQGGVEAMDKLAKQRAEIVYGEIDRNKMFRGTAVEEDRSLMNLCFVMADDYKELEKDFLDFAVSKGMVGVKGHRSVGGFRASCYNAQTIEGCQKVLVATEKPFAAAAVEGIRKEIEAAGNELALLEKYTEKAQLLDAVKDADALIIRSDKVDAEVLDAAKQLKIVVRAGAGYDNIDLAAATAHNVVAENTPGQNANAVAELVFGLLVFAVRNFYNGKAGTELMGKKLGILAFGNVGRNVARIAKGFGMDVYAYDAFCPAEVIEKAGVHAVANQEALFEQCDVVSLHIPATPETKQSINYALVGKMKKGGILVNTARKEVINEPELLKLMAERQDLKFVTDIMPDANADFLQFEGRYFSTPKKMGAQTAEANTNAGIAAAKQINAFFKDGDTKFQVNK